MTNLALYRGGLSPDLAKRSIELDFTINPDDHRFLAEVRQFLAGLAGTGILVSGTAAWEHANGDRVRRWLAALEVRGWCVPYWPVEHGGTGWSAVRRFLFEMECTRAGAPTVPSQGHRLAGPTIIAFGNDAQRATFLRGTANGTITWCQGFSEPGAGSDLAALTTSGRLEGDAYVVTGQKIWTTHAHYADWMFALVRTSTGTRPQQGISMILIDMRSRGIAVSPIETIDGQHHVNTVFFDDVIVPLGNLVGREGAGWDYARYMLEHERTGGAKVPELQRDLDTIAGLASLDGAGVSPVVELGWFQRRFADLVIELEALRWSILRVLAGDQSCPAAEMASILKVRGSELQQAVAQLAVDVLGPIMLSPAHPLAKDAAAAISYLGYRRAATIYAGSDEIQRNLLSRALLDT
jgi:alkylation response protein AidB-like acyl-CoA dehydrogenase